MAKPNFFLWTASSMRRVLPGDRPADATPDGVHYPTVRLSMAKGEAESFQILLRSPASGGLRSVRVETRDLVRLDGKDRIAARCIEWQQVGFVRVNESIHPHKWGARNLSPGWYPDPLLSVSAFDVKPDFTQSIWITVWTRPDVSAGVYQGSIAVHTEAEDAAIVPVRVRVYDVVFAPGAGHLRTSFELIDGFLEKLYGKPLPRQVFRRFGEFLLKHRLNPDQFSRNIPPLLDDLRHYRTLGMNSFCVVNLAKDRGDGIREGLNSPPDWYSEENWSALQKRVDPFISEMRKEPDLWSMAYVHGFDERDIETHGEAMRLFFGRAKERWGLPTLTTSHIPTDPSVMKDLRVDWLCPILAQYHLAYDFDRAERARAAGLKVWSYLSLEPYPPYPNWRLDSPLMEARTIWWQAFHQKMDGFLYWGLNVWDRPNNDRVIDAERDGPFLDFSISFGGSHDWLHGDGILLYPGKDGPIGSIRLANIRDGLEDYELLWLLAAKTGDREASRVACEPVTTALDRFTDDPDVLSRQREEILCRLEE